MKTLFGLLVIRKPIDEKVVKAIIETYLPKCHLSHKPIRGRKEERNYKLTELGKSVHKNMEEEAKLYRPSLLGTVKPEESLTEDLAEPQTVKVLHMRPSSTEPCHFDKPQVGVPLGTAQPDKEILE